MTRSACLYLLCTLLGLAWTPASASTKTLPNQLELREIGPWRGGRVTTVSGVPGDPMRYYMGAAGGGVWRTINGGASWENLSDGHFRVGTIGAIAVAPSDPKVLWVGTGEAPIRGVTTSHGDGVWRSVDEGASWTHLGLKDAGQISRIKVHPQDPDTAWIAVQGQIWGPSEQRGVFKTTDGGASWEHVLKVNASTGAADLAMDPNNPDHLYAALWHHGRTPWFILSGGEGGGIYKSTDGGSSWRQVTAGLPALVGKIGLDLAASMPSRLYAIVEAELGLGGLYVSDDFGEQWRLVNGRRVLHSRPWYYNHITVDPTDADTVWVQNVPLMKSTDGGVSFERVSTPHVDHHDHWINPDNPLNMISGNDGGGTITYDGGETWSSQLNQPTAQFYRVIADRQQPFRIYGGQQDNTTLSIASASATGGIGADDAYDVGGGESAHIAFDPDQPTRVYATTINNTLTEYDHSNNHQRSIVPYPEHVYGMNSRDLKYRANWNAPVLVSAHDPSVIYYGTQLLLKSTDRGRNWREISPDLTRNEPEKQGLNGGPITPENVGAEFYNTLFYLAESPQSAGTIWAGADDGLIHLTRDDGDSWSAITPAEAPEGQVNAIELSPHRDGKAYYALTRYKLNDFRPYIYRTGDFGQSWQRIDGGLPDDSFVRVVREDPRQEGVLYAGTEQGLWLSWNEGKDWQAWQMNLPPVPITDLTIADD
ncbi:MAG: glycosyl hydrolase, partial [Xanthomonadales bacterium]|nr:glycosyl hydrolase [Xanthomonadales bacterium]